MNFKLLNLLIIFGLILPSFCFGQVNTAAMPQNMGEAKDFSLNILKKLPEAVKKVWREEALPLWQSMWEWARPLIEPWWQKFLGLLGKEVEKRKPELEQEFQKEKEEMQEDIWERFKGLLD